MCVGIYDELEGNVITDLDTRIVGVGIDRVEDLFHAEHLRALPENPAWYS